jgi:hypothetical protein
MAINLLIAFGERGHPVLRAHLDNRPHQNWDHLDQAIIEALHEHPSTKTVAIEAAGRDLSRGRRSLDTPSFKIAAESSAANVREQILEAAFTNDRTIVGRAARAIEAIAMFDTARALEAASIELGTTKKTADSVCRLVVKVAGADAAAWLVNIAGTLEGDQRAAVGRALRSVSSHQVGEVLEGLLKSDVPTDRLLGLELASWTKFPSGERIHSIAQHDQEGKVRDAAATALQFRRELENGARLLGGVPDAPEHVQWSILHALIWSVHPSLLTKKDDELWLGHALDKVHFRLVHFAQKQLERRRNKI